MSVDLLVLSRYGSLGASSRVRSYQYVDSLRAAGFTVDVQPMFDNAYVVARNSADGSPRIASVASAYLRRLRGTLAAFRARVVWLEYELLPWLPFAVEQWLYSSKRPVIVDYDDAIFHRYDQHPRAGVRRVLAKNIDRIMASATAVVVGNEYLAERAKQSEVYHLHYAERKSLQERIGMAASGSVDRVLLSWWSRLTQQRFW